MLAYASFVDDGHLGHAVVDVPNILASGLATISSAHDWRTREEMKEAERKATQARLERGLK